MALGKMRHPLRMRERELRSACGASAAETDPVERGKSKRKDETKRDIHMW